MYKNISYKILHTNLFTTFLLNAAVYKFKTATLAIRLSGAGARGHNNVSLAGVLYMETMCIYADRLYQDSRLYELT